MPINIITIKNVELVCDRCGTNGMGMMNGEEVILLDGWTRRSVREGEEVICTSCDELSLCENETLLRSFKNLLLDDCRNHIDMCRLTDEILYKMSH